jgi:hypothetical protein
MRLRANLNDRHAKISSASSYIAYAGRAGAEIISSRNYDGIRDPNGNLHLRTKAQLRRDEEWIRAYLPPADEIRSMEDRT